jgi:hypothetical protein
VQCRRYPSVPAARRFEPVDGRTTTAGLWSKPSPGDQRTYVAAATRELERGQAPPALRV